MTDTNSPDVTPDQVVEAMPGYLIPEKAGSTTATIQFDLTGEDAGKRYLKLTNGQAESGQGEVEAPNVTLIADSKDFVKIFTGKMDGTAAFMAGKLKVKGDMGLAIRMQTMFRRPDLS